MSEQDVQSFAVTGMTCGHCVRSVTRALQSEAEYRSVRAELEAGDYSNRLFVPIRFVDFTAGYGSIFGDGNRVQADLCQHCVRKVLGRWLRVTEPTPQTPHRAFQPHQHPDWHRRRLSRPGVRSFLSGLENDG